MSGIAGLLNLDGGPIDGRLLSRLTRFMAFRGPDAQETWDGGRIGLGHAMLRTTRESRHEQQPCSLDGRVWIVADARVDGRGQLYEKLRSAGHDCRQGANDAELILYAYRAWGDECVRHLLGDFAFAIWDAPRERLFCARDHFGVKPFFYAHAGDCLVFSNTLNCVREHPGISDEPSDRAIADFLLYGINQDEATTAFAHIRRLPPAHRLIWSDGELQVHRYWVLPVDGHLRYRRAEDYVEHFTELLNTAVADRLRSDRIGVLMSGGLDSTSVAATARSLLSEQYEEFDLRAYACVYDRLFVDGERHFSGLAADSLGIPIQYLAVDDYGLFERWRTGELQLPEPADEPLAAIYLDQAKHIASHCRVALTGWDGDALLNENLNECGTTLYRGVQSARRAALMAWRALSRGRSARGELRAWLTRILAGPPEQTFTCPDWLNSSLVEELDLPARWRDSQEKSVPLRCRHPHARRVLTSPLLTNLLESYDPGVTRIPVETRHPLLDLRLVGYLLSLPASPWCVDKKLLRVAMQDRLPESVSLRPKTPLAGDPVLELLQRADARWVDAFEATPALGRYIARAAVPSVAGTRDPDQTWTNLRPLCLNFWLQDLASSGRGSRREEYHEVA
ncbi:MAG: asparagine synthetase B [Gammaproteobacteria bacterium]|jgi:asparagine synthase (glutamine-hydrolysing)|nr:asparagine synthetase B [Gammaproteobacteria bacterium]